MKFAEASERAYELREQFQRLEHARYGREWSNQEIALGLVGDVGDLMKLIQAKEGVRDIQNLDANLAHELADCLWSILVLARLYKIDLEQAFVQNMDQLEQFLHQELGS